jgi:hypothetical protein
MAPFDGPSPDPIGIILTGMFWLMPVLLSQRIPTSLDPPLSWVEWGLATAWIVAGIVRAATD